MVSWRKADAITCMCLLRKKKADCIPGASLVDHGLFRKVPRGGSLGVGNGGEPNH